MAAMFLLRADSLPEEATVSWTYVVAIVQAPVNKALADTKRTPRDRVRAPREVTSTFGIEDKARERKGGAVDCGQRCFQRGWMLSKHVEN